MLGCESPPPAPVHHVLTSGTVVDVDSTGAITLTDADGHELASTAGAPIARVFSQSPSMLQGFFTFRRTGVEETTFSIYEGAVVSGSGVSLTFSSPSGATARVDVDAEDATSTRVTLTVEGVDHASREIATALPFACDEDASFAGFGAQYNQTDQRGEVFSLWSQEQGLGRNSNSIFAGDEHTTYFPMPWWLDWRGFGVLIDTTARTNVDLCATDPARAWIEVEHGESFSARVFHGPTARDVVTQLGDVTGRPPMPPSWAFSPWIGMQRGRDAVLDEVDQLITEDVPFSAVWVQDWVGGDVLIGDIYDLRYHWIADEELYPDLAGMIDELHGRAHGDFEGVRFLGYANSFIVDEYEHYGPMSEMGLLPTHADGSVYDFLITVSNGSVADFTNPATYEYVEGFLRSMVVDYGMDGWMSDFGEWLPYDATLHEGDPALVHNRYPELWHRASRDVMDEARPDGDWVVFSRSGWTGDQAVQQIVWIGDQEATFDAGDGIPTVVPAILNLGLSAVPLTTHDIAGYSGGPSTKELYQRWTELGAFTTFMRTHEGLNALSNWNWNSDEETIAHFRRFARIHEVLRPELEALAQAATETSIPPMRHLALVFPNDVASRAVSEEFMLGETLLVAPVIEEGATTREVYLPPGTWFHVWTGTTYEGGQTITVEAPIGSPPVFSLGADRADLRAIE